MYVALSRWRWDDTAFIPSWRRPVGSSRALDLRSHAQSAITGGVGGFGLFEFDADPSGTPGLVVLGDDPQGLVPLQRKAALEAALGVTLDAARLGPMMLEAVTRKADPSGLSTRPRGLHPTGRRLIFRFGGFQANPLCDLADPELGANVLAVLKDDYRKIRQDVLDGKAVPELHRKVLGYWLRKFATRDYRQFQGNLPDEEPIEPTSTVTDSFNRSDNDDLNASTTGKNPTTWNWTEFSGLWDIASNVLRVTGGSGNRYVRADYDLSTDDHYCQIVNTTRGTASGVTCRHSSSAETFYLWYRTSTTHELYRANAASYTLLSDGGNTNADGDTLKLEVNGSVLKAYRNSVQDATVGDYTDSSPITGTLRCGLYGHDSTVHDNFEAADLDVATAKPKTLMMLGVG